MRVGSLFLRGEAGEEGEEEAGDEEEGEAMTGGGTAGSRRPPLGDY